MAGPQRISYVPLEEMTPEMREEMERCAREGTPRPESTAIRAHVPAAFWFFASAWNDLFRNGIVDHSIKELCRVYVSHSVKCEYCGNQRSERGREAGLIEGKYDQLLNFETSEAYSEREKTALAYAEAITWTGDADDALWERLRAHFSEPELVEFGCVIGLTLGQQSLAAPAGHRPPPGHAGHQRRNGAGLRDGRGARPRRRPPSATGHAPEPASTASRTARCASRLAGSGIAKRVWPSACHGCGCPHSCVGRAPRGRCPCECAVRAGGGRREPGSAMARAPLRSLCGLRRRTRRLVRLRRPQRGWRPSLRRRLANRRAPAGAALASRRGRRCGGSTAAAAELRGGIRPPRRPAARVRRVERSHSDQRRLGADAGRDTALATVVRRHVVRHAAVGAARRSGRLRPDPAPAARLRRSGHPVPQRHVGAHARRFARLAAAASGGAAAARARRTFARLRPPRPPVRGCSGARRAVPTSGTHGRSISPPTRGRR